MASLFRATVTRFYDADGRQCSSCIPGAKRVKEKSQTWSGSYKGPDGKPSRESLGTRDRDEAWRILLKRADQARKEATGDFDVFAASRVRPLADHLKEYRTAMTANGTTMKQAKQASSRVNKILDGCKFVRVMDLNASRVSSWLADRRKAGMAIQTSNHYLTAIKSFINWLVKDQRLASNPLAHLENLNPKVDIRIDRRAMLPEELLAVIEEAVASKKVFRGLRGKDRDVLYRTASLTGLRAAELGSLTGESFDLAATPPSVTVEATHSKRRRRDVLPLHSDLAARLRIWLAERFQQPEAESGILTLPAVSPRRQERLWPGTWYEKAAKMLRIDMKAARDKWIAAAKVPAEIERREKSDFLKPVDQSGYVLDFHGLRHTFISNLAAAGVHPKQAQELARHSDINLTLSRYTHASLASLDAALATLQVPCRPPLAATGTTHSRP